ncbi:MAG: arginine--tRNA ligase [Solirubrobacterales bacterium]
MNFIEDFKTRLRSAIDSALEDLKANGEITFDAIPEYVIEAPREKTHGDFAANVAMLMAKPARMAPRKIAEMLSGRLQAGSLMTAQGSEPKWVDQIEVAGAGFLNFRLNPQWLLPVAGTIARLGDRWGCAPENGKKVQVEFVSANPTGDLHMGNARGGAIGDSLANILKAAGYDVQKEFYVNDAGNQIELFSVSLEARYFEMMGRAFELPEGGYAGQDVIDTIREAVTEFGESLLPMDTAERRRKLVTFALGRRVQSIQTSLARFGIHYDVWFRESSLYQSGEVDQVVAELTEKDYIYEKEGAKWFRSTRFGDEKDEVVIRANGLPTYFAADIAYHKNKFRRGFDWVINVWGADHHGHVSRMKGAVAAVGGDPEKLDVVIMQLVRLYRNGEIVRMSKRTGTLVTLDELLDDVGVDAARFFFIMRSPDSHLDFELELAKKESQENPVYYAQYAHARICSIMRQAVAQGIAMPDPSAIDPGLLNSPEEVNLIRRLADFPEEIMAAARTMAPQRIPHYVMDLAGLLHSFYHEHRVLQETEAVRNARLVLMEATRITVKNALGLIGVNAPERM